MADLNETARALVAPGKGILAADESTRHDQEALRLDRRRVHRGAAAARTASMLFTTEGAADHISGVILYDETIRQSRRRRHAVPEVPASSRASFPGIKVDPGAKPLAGCPDETITEGLDGLRDRLAEYRELGARFAKWRAVISIGDGIPSEYCLVANAHALARYAALCQEAGIVPIVEPEVLMDGDHTIERCFEVTVAHAARRVRPSCATSASSSRTCCSSRTWSSPGYDVPGQASDRGRRADARVLPAPRAGARCPGSSSSPAARPTRRRPPA